MHANTLGRRPRQWGTVLFVGLALLPYGLAALWTPPDMHFTGLLLAWQDGLTYYAKMQQGVGGAWLYRLSMTANPGEGVALYPFYLALGHVARWLNLPLPWVYHAARALGAVALAQVLARHLATLLPSRAARWAWWGLTTGLGMGWLALAWGHAPADLWVTEMYPLASAYVNAHFPWALAALVALVTPGWLTGWAAGGVALALSALSPFGLVLALALRGLAWDDLRQGWRGWLAARWRADAAAWLLGGGYLAYTLYVLTTHPVLRSWRAQNRAPLPPVWDLALSLAPWWPLALFGLLRRRGVDTDAARRLWGGWLVLALGLALMPWGPQRRFLMGVAVPLAGLAALAGLESRTLPLRWVRGLAWPGVVFLVVLLPWQAAQGGWRGPYLSGDEMRALTWLAEHAPRDALVLAAPESGGFIAGVSGRRVLYGHPMETAQAAYWREATAAFFSCSTAATARAWLRAWEVDFVYYGPAEASYGRVPVGPDALRPVGQWGRVVIYQVGEALRSR